MARIDLPSYEIMSARQQAVHELIASGPRGRVRGPLAVWLHRPDLAERAQALGEYCRWGSALPGRLRELAILVTAVHWQAGFEWNAHAPLALKEGLSQDIVETLRLGGTPAFDRADEDLVYRFSTELLSTRSLSDEIWSTAHDALGPLVVDLIGVLGYYALISMTIKAAGVDEQEGSINTFAQDDAN